jgi:hypothetical protein
LNATLLLCDAAEEANGKLYVLGAGWTHVLTPNRPINMALAIVLHVPWEQANQEHRLEVSLLDEDGQPVTLGDNTVRVEGVIQVKQTAGTKPGSELNAASALGFSGVSLPTGAYVWQLLVNGESVARTPFWVQGPSPE